MKTVNNSNPYTTTENKFLCNHFRFITNKHLGSIIGRTGDAIRKQLKVLGLERSQAENTTLVNQIESVQIRYDDGIPMIWICIKGSWTEYHRYYWRKLGYRIPVGQTLEFKNGNHLDVRLDNLHLVSNGCKDVKNEIPNVSNLLNYQMMSNDSVRKHQRKEMFVMAMDMKKSLRKQHRDQVSEVRKEEKRQREINWSKSMLSDEPKIMTRDATVGKKPLRIDHRTTIYIPADADPETYRAKHNMKKLPR